MIIKLKKIKPIVGDIRIRKYFCLLPLIFDGYLYWFETVQIKEKLYEIDCMDYYKKGWKILEVYSKLPPKE